MSRLSPVEQRRHAEMISDPGRWPMWPLLPLRRAASNGDWPTLGFIVDRKLEGPVSEPVRVWNGLMYEASKIVMEGTDFTDYTTVMDVIYAGWEVD